MRFSPALFFYLGRHFLISLLTVGGGIFFVIYLAEIMEITRKVLDKKNVSIGRILEMAFYQLSDTGQQALPFIVLFGTMFTLWRLTRQHELVAIRSSGVSVWQFLFPMLAGAMLTGLIATALINPLSAAMLTKYERLESKLFKNRAITFNIARSGLWLRQPYSDGHALIHAESMNTSTLILHPVTVLFFKDEDIYAGRVDAQTAQLKDQYWELQNVQIHLPHKPVEKRATYTLPTIFTLSRIQESFAPPETLSFWEIPHFIATLKSMGLSSLQHQMHFQGLLAQPFLFCSMVLLAAAFSPQNPRSRGHLSAIGGALGLGFFLYFLTNIALAMGSSGNIPYLIAGWVPTIASLMLGTAALLQKEDG